jgi:hypothetical protein
LIYLDACLYNCKILRSLREKRPDEVIRRTKYLTKLYLQICTTSSQLGRHLEGYKAAQAALKYAIFTVKATFTSAKARAAKLKQSMRGRSTSETSLILLSQVQQAVPYLKAILKAVYGQASKGPTDMRSGVGLRGASDWMETISLENLLTLEPLTSAEFKGQGNMTLELSKDYVMVKLSLVIASLFCIATELKHLAQENAYSGHNPREV